MEFCNMGKNLMAIVKIKESLYGIFRYLRDAIISIGEVVDITIGTMKKRVKNLNPRLMDDSSPLMVYLMVPKYGKLYSNRIFFPGMKKPLKINMNNMEVKRILTIGK